MVGRKCLSVVAAASSESTAWSSSTVASERLTHHVRWWPNCYVQYLRTAGNTSGDNPHREGTNCSKQKCTVHGVSMRSIPYFASEKRLRNCSSDTNTKLNYGNPSTCSLRCLWGHATLLFFLFRMVRVATQKISHQWFGG